MMGAGLEAGEAVFATAGQAVHVAFVLLSQPAQQDAPFRKALIRAMESIQLTGDQGDWLDQLRGAASGSGSVNFGGLDGNEVRAQCAMIMQAVKSLPPLEGWVLQAKFGNTDFECRQEDSQLPQLKEPRRRWAFSAERIEAIKGLSDHFAPMFPKIKPLAVDCMLGRLFANHKKLDISSRDLADSFGGNHTMYLRASIKMKQRLLELEYQAIDRLEPQFIRHGVSN
ncbi:hypothetical protein AAKU55_005294 [Oxalobacteraceae bacterium GrIS 1.11]